MSLPSPARLRDTHALLTADPHIAGSPRDRVLAEWIRDRWREYGLEQVEIVEHDVLLPYATDVLVETTVPPAAGHPRSTWRASLREEPIEGDPFSTRDVGSAYHAYSASGDVTASVVYAGSGSPSDYDWLAQHGVDVKGKIVLVRYSVPYSYRGYKALTAEQRGAAGILIYSDPADDGFRKGATYPQGPWGPESHIQRGGVVYDFRVPGDPLTPGWASTPGARRIDLADAVSLPKILSVPLSWRDARSILEALGGQTAPSSWQGGIPPTSVSETSSQRSGLRDSTSEIQPQRSTRSAAGRITYRVGPGPATVHLRVQNDDKIRPIWTVTGRITGTMSPDQRIVIGNHRDAWAFGGVDPSSGTAALMEVARALGTLAKQGARPHRTIELASWDAEEFSLTSSTEWGEQHADDLARHAVAYLNVDSAAGGPDFKAAAVPALNHLVIEAARDTLGLKDSDDAIVSNRLGSGSDYTVFLNFLGVPVADMTYTGPYGVYHSLYDNHLWVQKFGDPGFLRQTAMARLWGVMALRLANADVVPLDYRATATRLREFVDETLAAASSPDQQALRPLVAAADRFASAAAAAGRRFDAFLATDASDRREAAVLDEALIRTERAFLDVTGLPGRPWYRHLLFAPKPTYASEVLPGVTETIGGPDQKAFVIQVTHLVSAIDRAAAVLDAASQQNTRH
jgi:N-acetylated-alpha-linked acidic dipeptidase